MPRKQRQRSIKGKGDYSEQIKKIASPLPRLEAKIDHLEKSLVHATPLVKTAAATIGRTLGNFVNQGDLGALAGSSLAKLFGHGDYTVKSNTLAHMLQPGVSGPNPVKFSKDGKRGTRIVEREFLMDVTSGPLVAGATSFTNTSFSMNVTNVDAFPWLSTIANQYDQWEPHGIVFEFVSTSSSFNGASQALGTIVMATDYDVTDIVYASKQVMENSDYACSTRPSENLVHGIECDPEERPTRVLYTGSNQVSLSSLGNFQLATVGCSTAGVKLGELWVSYDITFYKKQLQNPSAFRPFLNATGTTGVGVGYFVNPVIVGSISLNITQNVGVGSVLNFPVSQGEGFYYLNYFATTANNDTTWTGTNCTIVNRVVNIAGVSNMQSMTVSITAPGAFVTTGLTTAAKTYVLIALPAPILLSA